jgi:hypothetical protein
MSLGSATTTLAGISATDATGSEEVQFLYGPDRQLAGPHDFLNSFQYNFQGDLGAFWQRGIGMVLGDLSGGVTLVPATAFVGALAAPELAYVKEQ